MEEAIKQNYLNNRDIMKEIHLSKNSYCSFVNPVIDHQYDIILADLSEISNNIAQAKENRAQRQTKETGIKVDPATISENDLIFRIMTWDHIPLLPAKIPKPVKLAKPSANKKITIDTFFEDVIDDQLADDELDLAIDQDLESLIEEPITVVTAKSQHIRINFPPFFHYKLSKNVPYVVGKSHWHGDLNSGAFCKTHGAMTTNLALMLMKLAEKYASKGNWRNYSYREEMQGQAVLQLCQVALQFDESKSSNPFSFLTTVSHNAFLRILNLEKKNQSIRDDLLIQANKAPSYSRDNRDARNAVSEYD